jgi:hypothetical protein
MCLSCTLLRGPWRLHMLRCSYRSLAHSAAHVGHNRWACSSVVVSLFGSSYGMLTIPGLAPLRVWVRPSCGAAWHSAVVCTPVPHIRHAVVCTLHHLHLARPRSSVPVVFLFIFCSVLSIRCPQFGHRTVPCGWVSHSHVLCESRFVSSTDGRSLPHASLFSIRRGTHMCSRASSRCVAWVFVGREAWCFKYPVAAFVSQHAVRSTSMWL